MTVPYLIALAFTLMFPSIYADSAKVIISLVVITSTVLELKTFQHKHDILYRCENIGWLVCFAFISWPLTHSYL